jgi:hypothetical protein
VKPRAKKPSLLRHYLGFLRLLLVIAAIPLLLLASCQSQLLYFPRPFNKSGFITKIALQTSMGSGLAVSLSEILPGLFTAIRTPAQTAAFGAGA